MSKVMTRGDYKLQMIRAKAHFFSILIVALTNSVNFSWTMVAKLGSFRVISFKNSLYFGADNFADTSGFSNCKAKASLRFRSIFAQSSLQSNRSVFLLMARSLKLMVELLPLFKSRI